jgi:MoxR-like ATPase
LDRFFLKLFFSMPSREDLDDIVLRTSAMSDPPIRQVADAATLIRMHDLVSQVPMARHVVDYASRIVLALQPGTADTSDLVRRHVRLGPSPRGAQALCLGGRVRALLSGRYNLAFEDIRFVAKAALRHRMILTFDAQRQGVSPDTIVDDVIAQVPEESR